VLRFSIAGAIARHGPHLQANFEGLCSQKQKPYYAKTSTITRGTISDGHVCDWLLGDQIWTTHTTDWSLCTYHAAVK
jgi:hypothetical protein